MPVKTNKMRVITFLLLYLIALFGLLVMCQSCTADKYEQKIKIAIVYEDRTKDTVTYVKQLDLESDRKTPGLDVDGGLLCLYFDFRLIACKVRSYKVLSDVVSKVQPKIIEQ